MSIDPKLRLQDLGIPFSETSFLEYVGKGDEEIVDLMLSAGIRPTAADSNGHSAITIATLRGHAAIVRNLLARGAPIEDVVNTIHLKSKQKDLWEKLSSVSAVATIISGIIIAGVGGWFTRSYNQAQVTAQQQQQTMDRHLKEVEIVEKMIPHLAAEDSRQAALVAIEALTDKDLSTRLAQVYKGGGSVRYLQELITSSNSSESEKIAALNAIVQVLDEYRPSIVKLDFDGGWVTGFVVAVSEKNSIIATASYVANSPPFEAKFFDDSTHSAKLLKIDGAFAFFSTDSANLKPRAAAKTQPVIGMRVVGVGFIEGSTSLQVQLGTILSVSADSFVASYDGNDRKLKGFGGSPILDSQGQVLGIAESHQGGNNHVVARYLKETKFLP